MTLPNLRWGEIAVEEEVLLGDLLQRTRVGSTYHQKIWGTMRSSGRRRVQRRQVLSTLLMKRDHTVLLHLLSPLPCLDIRKGRRRPRCMQAMQSAGEHACTTLRMQYLTITIPVTAACMVTSWSRMRWTGARHRHGLSGKSPALHHTTHCQEKTEVPASQELEAAHSGSLPLLHL